MRKIRALFAFLLSWQTFFGLVMPNPLHADSFPFESSYTLQEPVLETIQNDLENPSYVLSWTAVPNAKSYIVQESETGNFSNPQNIISTTQTAFQVSGKIPGVYYYRVIAIGETVTSCPSNIQSTIVSPCNAQPLPQFDTSESWNDIGSIDIIGIM